MNYFNQIFCIMKIINSEILQLVLGTKYFADVQYSNSWNFVGLKLLVNH